MLFEKIMLKEFNYQNGHIDTKKVYDNFYYDKDNLIRCPDCNNLIFYIENYTNHNCPIKDNYIEINESIIKDKSNKFLCKIDNIENKCVIHKKEFKYYKNSNYYCSLCLEGNNIKDYLNLDEIILSKEEINKFKKLIEKCENEMKKIKIKCDNFIEKLKENYEIFLNRNKLLIEYCKSLLEFNNKYKNNFNLISTIRRISIGINNDELLYNKDFNEFFMNRNIIKFNNELVYQNRETYEIYFNSEKVIKNGQYYLKEKINDDGDEIVYKALSTIDKKIVAIKKLPIKNNNFLEDYLNESNILKEMKDCEYSVKYIDSFKENNYYYIITEFCDDNLKNLLNNNINGLSIQTIKKIFCQINEGFKYLKNKQFLHNDLKPENILFNKIIYNNEIINYRYKICNYGFSKYLNELNKSKGLDTQMYVAPEVKNFIYKDKSDLFSIGIILYELYYGNNDNLKLLIILKMV